MTKLKYVQRQGSYHYFRHPRCERVRLNGTPGSTEYLDHYRRLLERTRPTAPAPAPHAEPETKRIARLKRSVSKLKVPKDDHAFLREAIDVLTAKRARERAMDAWLNRPQNYPLHRLRKSGWQMDEMLGIEH
jgi:hypothetical protein